MTYTTISCDRRGHVAWITLNRPAAMNAISSVMIEELIDALEQITADAELRALVITGAGGRAFCGGADLKEVRAWLEGPVMPGKADFLNRLTSFFELLRAVPKPVIAAVNGIAVAGGLEIVMACDLVLAAETAVFGDAHSNFGLFPGAGGAAVLPRRIGINRAKYLLFTGEVVSAHEMMAFGIVNQVVATPDLASSAQALGERLATKSPRVLRKIKEVVNRALDQTETAALQEEMLALREHLRSADVREGLAAFAEKRNPEFEKPDLRR
jgi:enoyl-CoA hydratase